MSQSRYPDVAWIRPTLSLLTPQQLILPPTCGLLRILLMARLSFLTVIFISLFVATLVNSQLSSQQPVTGQDGAVHTTDSWSWDDCGQSFCI